MKNEWNHDLTNFSDAIPLYIIPWLRYTKCVTLYCKKARLNYQLKLLEQFIDEPENIFIRKTISFIEGEPAIFAKTTIPSAAYQQFKNVLDNLDNKPIGENLLFKEYSVRGAFKYNVLKPNTSEYDNALYPYTHNTKPVFARISTFDIKSYKIDLQENFLHSISRNAPLC